MHKLVIAGSVLIASSLSLDAAGQSRVVQHRRPSAAVVVGNGESLAVANRRSGSVCLIDFNTKHVREHHLGQQLSDLIEIPGSSDLLVTDFAAGTLIPLSVSEGRLEIQGRIEVEQWPNSVCTNETGSRICVASLWSRRLSLLRRVEPGSGAARLTGYGVVNLPFAPGDSAFIGQTRILVSDAFGGRLAIVDCEQLRVLSVVELPIHNIRQIHVGSDGRVYLTAQKLNPRGRTEHEHVHWGVLIENLVLAVDVETLTRGMRLTEQLIEKTSLGEAGNGAGDPSGVSLTDDRVLVTSAGKGELILLDRVGVREVRLPVGSRPVRVTLTDDQSKAFVLNELSDTVSVVDLQRTEVVSEISLGPSPESGPVERGERAFYDSTLSYEGWFSCHSCHTDGHTSNRLADTLGDGDFGAPKQIPTLLGVWATGPWAWNGSQGVLQKQITKSLETTLLLDDPSDELASDLAAYLTTLRRPPSISVARRISDQGFEDSSYGQVFKSAGCAECHNDFTSYTTDGVFDVGLSDAIGRSEFNPPSLSGVSQRDRFFHDGRATSLKEVITRFEHPSGTSVSEADRRLLIQFLDSL